MSPTCYNDLFANPLSTDCAVSREQFLRLQIIASRGSRVSPFPCCLEQPNRVKDPPQFVNGYRSSLIAHLYDAWYLLSDLTRSISFAHCHKASLCLAALLIARRHNRIFRLWPSAPRCALFFFSSTSIKNRPNGLPSETLLHKRRTLRSCYSECRSVSNTAYVAGQRGHGRFLFSHSVHPYRGPRCAGRKPSFYNARKF